jgi:predicted MPP superfamily phosphohydrolase
VVGLLSLAAWGFWFEPRRLVVREVQLAIPHWNAGNDQLRVAVLTDIHVGSPHVGLEKLSDIVNVVNSGKPDLVLLLGDLVIQGVSGGQFVAPEASAKELRRLVSRLGTYGVLGNHDWWLNAPRVTASLRSAGVVVLEDTAQLVASGGRRLWLAGVSDYWEGRHDVGAALKGVPAGESVILFTHNPDVFPDVPETVSLAVAGHTHGGQVNIPFLTLTPLKPDRASP